MRNLYRERVDEGGEFADAIEQEALIQRLYASENEAFKKYRKFLSIIFILQVTIINISPLRKQYPGTTLLAVFSIILTAAHLNLDLQQLVDSEPSISGSITRIVFNSYFYHSVNIFVCTRLIFKVVTGGTPLAGLYLLPVIDLIIGISLLYWNTGKKHDISKLKQLKTD